MAEGVAHEIDGGRLAAQRAGAGLGQQHGDGVEEHRGRAGQLAIGRQPRTIGQCDAANPGRDDLGRGARLHNGLLQRIDGGPIAAIADQDADAAALQRVAHLADQLQGRRRLQVTDLGSRRRCHGAHAEAGGHPLRKAGFDGGQVADHGLAHMRRLDLGQLEHQGRGDVRLLRFRLAAVEHPRLAVVIGKSL